MPVFDYRCPECGHISEHYVQTADEVVTCLGCEFFNDHLIHMVKQPAAPAFHLKGSGWDKQPPKEGT